MSISFGLRQPRHLFIGGILVALTLGIVLRIYNLLGSGFFFYDEGLYLNHNLPALELIHKFHPQGADAWQAFLLYLKMALGSGKSLWFFIIDSRFLFNGIYAWGFAKGAACFFGLLVILLVYFFARRFYQSRNVGLLAAGLMAVLPGAVFYSRIALQEALSTVLVLAGFYFYLFSRRWEGRIVFSGILLAAAFFANYRLLMLPALVCASEIWSAWAEKRVFDFRRYIWFCVVFASCVVGVGSVLDAANMKVVFSWVFHQEQMASAQFSWINLLSYPYYLFRLETWPLAACFFGGFAYLVWRKAWVFLLPTVLVFFQMAIFSLTSEKGARYIAVVLPFICMTVAYVLVSLWQEIRSRWRYAVLAVAAVVFLAMSILSLQLSQASSAHERAVRDLVSRGEKFFSSQELVDVLYLGNKKDVQPIPRDFSRFVEEFGRGYRYLILDPQAYVSQTQGPKFTSALRDYVGFIDRFQKPVGAYPHMNRAFLDRFVLEHSENLLDSIRFINDKDVERYSLLRVYELSGVVPQMRQFVDQMKKRK